MCSCRFDRVPLRCFWNDVSVAKVVRARKLREVQSMRACLALPCLALPCLALRDATNKSGAPVHYRFSSALKTVYEQPAVWCWRCFYPPTVAEGTGTIYSYVGK